VSWATRRQAAAKPLARSSGADFFASDTGLPQSGTGTSRATSTVASNSRVKPEQRGTRLRRGAADRVRRSGAHVCARYPLDATS